MQRFHLLYVAPTVLLLALATWPLISGDETLYIRDVLTGHYPMKVAQAEALCAALEGEQILERVILLNVPEETLVERALGRGRVDDTEETIRHRLRVYHESTCPVLDALEGRVERVEIDGVGGIEEITARIEEALGA